MTRKDYDHLKHELDNICTSFTRHRNPADCAVANEVVNTFKTVLDGYFAYCDAINHNRIPGKTGPEYKHNDGVYGSQCSDTKLWGGNHDCDHEIYAQCSGGIKCIKCGAWYCA